MTRRPLALLMALFLLLPMAAPSARGAVVPNSDVLFTAEDVPTALRQAEERLSIRITDRTRSGLELSTLKNLEEALNLISFDLFAQAAGILREKYGITVEIIFCDYANQGYAGLTTLALSSRPEASCCTIELVRNPDQYANSGTDMDVMVHELVHLLHYVAEYIWDSTELRDQFYTLNGMVSYYEDCRDGLSRAAYLKELEGVLCHYFADDYGSTNYYEDAASLLQAICVDDQRWEAALLHPDNRALLGKYRALVRLLEGRLDTARAAPLLQLLPDDWALSGWQQARALGLVPQELDHGYSGAITRVEFCRLITALMEAVWGEEPAARLAGQGYGLSTPFQDTDSMDVAVLYALGIVNGRSSVRFAPEDAITRQEAAKLLALTAQAVGGVEALAGEGPAFADAARFDDWGAGPIAQVSAAGIMNGTGNGKFSPDTPYTRQQSFLTALRLYRLVTALPAAEEVPSPEETEPQIPPAA